MNFMSLFRPNTDPLRIVEFKDNYYQERLINEDKIDFDEVPIAVFHLTQEGPSVLYRDFERLAGIKLGKEDLTKKINTLAANLIAATGSGHSYSEGCFDFKFENVNKYRLFVIAIRKPNKMSGDPRIKNGYYHIVLFVPKYIALNLPSISKMEDDLYNLVSKEMKNSDDFYPEKIQILKEKLVAKLLSFDI